MALIVQKYGGSSVATVEKIKHVANRVKETKEKGNQVVVIVSAMGDTTDDLISLAKQISTHPNNREMDMLMTTGEQVSIALISMALQEIGVDAISLTGWQAGIKTEEVFSKARIVDINTNKIEEELEKNRIVIVAGFQGISDNKEITTLGRGGSDTTAVALAAALKADQCEIYTDVLGVYTADPRIVKESRKLQSISYDEMLELATLGAVVLHPRAVEYAKMYNVTLYVRSTFSNDIGTRVEEVQSMEKGLVVTGIAHDLDVTKVQVLGMVKSFTAIPLLFNKLAEARINVDIIVHSEVTNEKMNIAFTISQNDLHDTIAVLEESREILQYDELRFEQNLAKVSIVGAGMITNPGVAAKMFSVLSSSEIPVKMISTSEIKVSVVIPKEQAKIAVNILHNEFSLNSQTA